MENFEETKPEQTAPGHHDAFETEPLIVTEDMRSYIYETSKWAKFLSILGFIFSGLVVIGAFSAGAVMSTMNGVFGAANPYAALGSGFLTVMLLLSALLYFYPSLLLFKYATSARQAVLFGDQAGLTSAMGKMKSFFKFWGILTIVALAFYLILILFVVVAGIGAASMGS